MEGEEDSGCEAPTKVAHRPQAQTRKLRVIDFGRTDLVETRAMYQGNGIERRGWHIVVLQCLLLFGKSWFISGPPAPGSSPPFCPGTRSTFSRSQVHV